MASSSGQIGADVAGMRLAQTFVAVYEERSMGGAARVLGVSQSTVSRQVATLESRLGVVLFERHRAGLVPTRGAQQLAEGIAQPVRSVLRAVSRPQVEEGAVLIGSSADLLAALVIPPLSPLVAAGLRVAMEVGLPDQLRRRALSGGLDVLVLPRIPAGISALYVLRPLLREHLVLVAAPRWAERTAPAGGTAADAARAIPSLALASPPPFARRWWRQAAGTTPPLPALVLPDVRGLRSAAVAGAGAVVLPRFMVAEELTRGRLVELVAAEVPVVNDIHLAWRRAAAPAAMTVVDALVAAHADA